MKTGVGERLGDRYVLRAPIGAGGMAEVWRGHDEVLDRPVAVKVLHAHLAGDETVFERFRHEAVMAARLSHPCIVRVFDTGVDAGRCYIVLELFEGETLADVLARRGSLPAEEASAVLRAVLSGLAHAHQRGVIHRDLKPGNVLIHDGQIKVADFGIAKAAFVGDLTATGELLGTAAYLAPEQVDASTVDHRADLYGAGIILYEMLTGRPPFRAESPIATATLRLTRDPEPPGTLADGIPSDLEAIVMRGLARDPERRFGSAQEMRSALERSAMAVTDRVPVPPPAPPAEGRAAFLRSWMLVPAVIVILGVLAVAVGVLLGRLELGGPLGVRTRGDERGPASPEIAELTVAEVRAHDPEGDGREHDDQAPLAIDGDPATAWTTEGYNSPDLGGVKTGVGLVFDLGETRDLREVTLATPAPGWSFEIRGSDDGSSFAPALPDARGARTFTAGPRTRVLLEDVETRYVLVWITHLVDVDGRYRAQISEASFAGG